MNRIILRTEQHRERAAAWISHLPISDPPLVVSVAEFKAKRSNEQNDMMWALVRAIAQGDEVERTKDRLLMKWAGYDVKELPDGTQYPVPTVGGSSKLDKEQMGDFINYLLAFCAEWGIEVDL